MMDKRTLEEVLKEELYYDIDSMYRSWIGDAKHDDDVSRDVLIEMVEFYQHQEDMTLAEMIEHHKTITDFTADFILSVIQQHEQTLQKSKKSPYILDFKELL